MANDENLVPFTSDQSHDEAVKNGRAGGIASGKARREQKTMREWAKVFGAIPITAQTPGGPVETTTLGGIVVAQMQKATKGDTKAAKFVSDLLGETYGEGAGLTLIVNSSDEGKANIEKILKGE